MKQIPLTKGLYALVDDEYFDELSQYSWCYHGDGYAARGYHQYGRVCIVKLHQAILGKASEGFEIDHINGNKLDNRRCNLRMVTHQQNVFNSKKRKRTVPGICPSKFKGVNWRNDRKKWRSCITLNGQRHYLGLYATEYEAALAYNKAAIKYHGEYANLNEI